MSDLIAIGFDFDHTLAIDNKLERTVGSELLLERASPAGVTLDPQVVIAGADEALHAYRSGQATVDVAWGALFARLIGSQGDEGEFIAEFRRRCLANVLKHVQILPKAKKLLSELAQREIPVALLTNGWSPLQEAKAEAIGFEGPVLVSERIGVRKPDPAAFAFLERHFGAPADAIWYVGDDPLVDVAAARAAGQVGVWFDWEGHAYPADATPPSHVIHELDALTALLPGAAH